MLRTVLPHRKTLDEWCLMWIRCSLGMIFCVCKECLCRVKVASQKAHQKCAYWALRSWSQENVYYYTCLPACSVEPNTWSVLSGTWWINEHAVSASLSLGIPSLILVCLMYIHVSHTVQLRAQTHWLEILQRTGEEWRLLEAQNFKP